MTTRVKHISKAKASQFQRALEKHYQSKGWDTDHLTLSWDWRGDGHPVIIWESGAPYNWTIELEPLGIPGVWHEAYDACIITLYPTR